MLKFSQFLLSEDINTGGKIHYQGKISEYTFYRAINHYHNLRQQGRSHQEALNDISNSVNKPDNHILSSTDDNDDIKSAIHKGMHHDDVQRIINNSLISSVHFINHLHQHHGEIAGQAHWSGPEGEKATAEKFGAKTNADIIVPVRSHDNSNIESIKLVGNSLKYNTSKSGSTKLRSPGLQEFHDRLSNLITKYLYKGNSSHRGVRSFQEMYNATKTATTSPSTEAQQFIRDIHSAHNMPLSNRKIKSAASVGRLLRHMGTKRVNENKYPLMTDEQREQADMLYNKHQEQKKDIIASPFKNYYHAASNMMNRLYKLRNVRHPNLSLERAVHGFNRSLLGIEEGRAGASKIIPTYNVSVYADTKSPHNTQTRIVDVNRQYNHLARQSHMSAKPSSNGVTVYTDQHPLVAFTSDRPGETESTRLQSTVSKLLEKGPYVFWYNKKTK